MVVEGKQPRAKVSEAGVVEAFGLEEKGLHLTASLTVGDIERELGCWGCHCWCSR